MEDNTAAIVRLAWTRILGLPDGALEGVADQRTMCEGADTITFVRLWAHRVLVAPAWFLDRARTLSDAELTNGSQLLARTAGYGGRLLGDATLAYLDGYLESDELDALTVTDDPAALVDLELSCPPDDVAEVGLAELGTALVTLDELDRPTAGAGYDEWAHLLAHLGVLTPPEFRRRGHGGAAVALASNDALDAGLVPQWRARVENGASRRLATRLGFTEIGSQTTVLLPR